MWRIYTMEYYSAIKRNKTELFVVSWMELETVIQSEVSQKEKNKYTHYIWNLKKKERKKMVRRTSEQDRNKDADLLENGLEDTGRGKVKLGQSERVAWTYIHYQT